MFILGLETTGKLGTVAAIDCDTRRIISRETTEDMSHLKNIAGLSYEIIKEMGDNPGGLAVSIGPGSFTGIRIGVTTIRTMAQALDLPVVGVRSLDCFRLRCNGSPVASIINARRGQVYGAVYGGSGEDILPPGPYMLTDIIRAIDELNDVTFYGDGVDAYYEELMEALGEINAPEENRYQMASDVVKIALDRFLEGKVSSYDEIFPDYMRLAEAEQKLMSGELKGMKG